MDTTISANFVTLTTMAIPNTSITTTDNIGSIIDEMSQNTIDTTNVTTSFILFNTLTTLISTVTSTDFTIPISSIKDTQTLTPSLTTMIFNTITMSTTLTTPYTTTTIITTTTSYNPDSCNSTTQVKLSNGTCVPKADGQV